MSKPESRLIEKIKHYVKELGGKVIKVHQSGFSEAGVPDLIVMTPKHGMFMVETKAPGEEIKKLQMQKLIQINQAGGRAWWCSSIEEFVQTLDNIQKSK